MIYLTYWLTRREFVMSYPTRIQFLFGFLAAALSLMVYAFTSKALEPAFASHPETQNLFHGSFFAYIVLGELILSVPIHLLSSSADTVKQLIVEESFEHWLLAPGGLLRPLLSSAIGKSIKDWTLVFTSIGVAAWLMNLPLGFTEFFAIFFYQVLFFPLFFGLGLVSVALIIGFGRGAGMVSQLGMVLTVFAGVFFPLKALPNWLQELSLTASPYTLFLESLRNSITSGDLILSTSSLIAMCLWMISALLIGVLCVYASLAYRRRKGDPIVLIPEG